MIRFLVAVIILLFYKQTSFAQTDTNQSIINQHLKAYFSQDRESIHLHLNKEMYLTSEDIWFKGYITEKKSAQPYASTANVHINLLNADGKILLSKTYYVENSLFEGNLPLNESFPSGKYQLQAFTNYMNNFIEDESSLTQVIIVDQNGSSYPDFKTPNTKALEIAFFPESGVFLEGITNSIAIKITDCNGNGVATQGKIHSASAENITTFTTNAQGYGKFDIKNTTYESYTAIFEIDNRQYKQNLPTPKLIGVAFTANNYAFNDKVVLHIKTNDRTLKSAPDAKYKFVIHQTQPASTADFSFKNGQTEVTIPISTEYLSDGLNSIRLLNAANEQMAERVVYKPVAVLPETKIILLQSKVDSLIFRGIAPLKFASLSISALPTKAVAVPNTNISADFQLNNYLKSSVRNPHYYLTNFNRKKHFELDNLLITATSKYDWKTMLTSIPEKKFDFEGGFTVKGTVNSAVTNRDKVQILMTAPFLGISERTAINAANEFTFTNVMAIDSSTLFFSLIDDKGKYNKANLYTRIVNPNTRFLRNAAPTLAQCNAGEIAIIETDFPETRNAIMLEGVNVDAKPVKQELSEKYKYRHSNNMSRGYKISETDVSSFHDVLQWIGSHGYRTSVQAGRVSISRHYSASFSGSTSPTVYMDDAPIIDLDLLSNMSMRTIDEIYINRSGYGAGSSAPGGIIRIYTKKGMNSNKGTIKINSQALIVNGGFQPFKMYENPEYQNVNDSSFALFGTLGWLPVVDTDLNGAFTFVLPNLYQESVLLLIEGISAEGQTISQQIVVPIPHK